jgi:hypothetical protein
MHGVGNNLRLLGHVHDRRVSDLRNVRSSFEVAPAVYWKYKPKKKAATNEVKGNFAFTRDDFVKYNCGFRAI